MNNSFRYNVSLVIVFFSIIWVPLQRLLIMIDGAGRIPYVLMLIAVLINLREIEKYCFRKPIVFYVILAPLMFINGLAHGSQELYDTGFKGVFLLLSHTTLAPMIMLVVSILAMHNYNKTLNAITIALLLYSFVSVSSGEIATDGRLESAVTNANEVALMVSISFCFVFLQYIRNQVPLAVFLVLSGLLITADIMTGSRMGFGMIIISTVFSVLLLRKKGDVVSSFSVIILFIIGFYLLNYAIDNTVVGERIREMQDKGVGYQYSTGTFLDTFGDRGPQYYYSWPYFLQHPILGIGFHQWINYNPAEFVAHSEYIVAYVENGFIGFVLYVFFFFGLMIEIWKNRISSNRIDSQTMRVLVASMLSIVFGNFVLWSYDNVGVFSLYGIAYAMICRSQMRIRLLKD